MQDINIWIKAFSGLGLFLFGMFYLESQIKASAGHSFKKIMSFATNTTFKSVLMGIGSTSIFQSSSVVSLMTLSLIGAGLITLQSAIAVIVGANLGTTATAWLMALFGFKFDITFLSYAIIGIGGLGSVLSGNKNRLTNYFGIMVGIGLIFLGLGEMKESLGSFAKNFDISTYSFKNPYWYALVGLMFTAVIQSSSASIAIIQSALFAGLINFDSAAAFVLGADVGTTFTVVIGAIGGIANKKRTAAAQVIFNLSTDILALILLKPLVGFVDFAIPQASSVVKIAFFHTLYNFLGIVVWYPFISIFAKWLHKFFKAEPVHASKYIYKVSAEVPDLAIEALRKEMEYLSEKIERFSLMAINIPMDKIQAGKVIDDKLLDFYSDNMNISYKKNYEKIRLLEGEIFRYILTLSTKNQNKHYQEILNHISQKTTYLATAVKSIEDMLYDLEKLYNSVSEEELDFYRSLRFQIFKNIQIFQESTKKDKNTIEKTDNTYKILDKSYDDSAKIIEKIAKNLMIPSDMTTIAVNDIHLSKSFSKAIRNALSA